MLLAEAVLEWPGLKRLRERCWVKCGRGMMDGKLGSGLVRASAWWAALLLSSMQSRLPTAGSAVQEDGSWDKMRVGRCQVARGPGHRQTGTADGDGALAEAGEACLCLAEQIYGIDK